MESVRIGVIGGSGLYNMPELTDVQEYDIETPFGPPSSPITVGTLAGQRVAFIARHGRGHVLTPSEVPYRANIYAFKVMGVQKVIGISACGSLREDYAPGHIVVPDQVVDWTRQDRGGSFFEEGLVAHVSLGDPLCDLLGAVVAAAAEQSGAIVHRQGTYITIEGPRFSTRAESQLYRQWGMSIIGMTTSPEAFLAREAEMCYTVMAHVTDYDVWHDSAGDVTVEMVLNTLEANLDVAQQALMLAVEQLGREDEDDCDCYHALENALITAPTAIPEETFARLRPLVGKYLDR